MESSVSGDVTTASSGRSQASPDYELYLVSTILACLAVIGTVGNAIVIYVFNRKKDKSVSAFFIITLAVIDFVICLFIIPYVIFMEIVDYKIHSDFICKTSRFLVSANRHFSAFLMVAIAIDRYLCICHPLKRLMTVPRAKLIVVCMAVIASVIGVCVSLTFGVNAYKYESGMTKYRKQSTPGISQIDTNSSGIDVLEKESSAGVNPVSSTTEAPSAESRNNSTYTGVCKTNEFIFGKEYREELRNFRNALYLVCFVTVLVLYILIYRSVLLQRKTRSNLQKKAHLSLSRSAQKSITASCHSNRASFVEGSVCASTTSRPSSDDDVLDSPSPIIRPRNVVEGSSRVSAGSAAARVSNLKTAAMLFVVTLVFAASCLPSILMQYRLMPASITGFYMYFFNSVANPIIYSFMNRNFREKVKNLISRR